MDCNKDDAMKAKQIAEERLLDMDATRAKDIALRAQKMYPKLDGLSQFIEVVNMYVSKEKIINGDLDLYSILSANPFSDEDTLKRHCRRMALAPHPDKNQSIRADDVFKILSHAWSVLSDKNQRAAYDTEIMNAIALEEIHLAQRSTILTFSTLAEEAAKMRRRFEKDRVFEPKPSHDSAKPARATEKSVAPMAAEVAYKHTTTSSSRYIMSSSSLSSQTKKPKALG